jgi:tetratricopeptide (TPR) repeat protein
VITRAIAAAALVVAQAAHSHSDVAVELAQRPVPLRTGIGSAHDTVSTSSNDAQAFYDQGLAYLHSYVWLEAARSFNQALRLDPNLAMAHLGLTVAYVELNAPAAARDALARAQALGAKANADDRTHDVVHIGARAIQMASENDPRDAAKLTAYRAALDAALAKFPDDEELWLARGRAESPDPAERGQGSVAGSIRFYENALALAPAHFAARHYLTHAYENTGRFDESLAESAAYARMAPNVPHARHMHGHSLRRVGKTDEAIEEFRAADALETSYFETEAIPAGHDWHYQHNLDLLAASYQYLGRMKMAEPLFRTSFAIASPLVVQEFNKRAWPVFLRARGRIDEALSAARVMAGHRSPIVSAAGHVEAGRALLAQGKFQPATEEANAALRLMKSASEGAGLVATPLEALQGEFFLRTGQRERGRMMLEQVTREVRAAAGPDAWTQATFEIEAIARAAREADDWTFAAWAARQMIEHDARYAGAHYALALAARHEGDEKTAQAELALAAQYWVDADSDLPELKTIRSTRP